MSEPAVDAMGRAQVLVGIAARRVGQPVEYSDPSTDRPYWVWERGRRQVRLYPDPWCHMITVGHCGEVKTNSEPLTLEQLLSALSWMRGDPTAEELAQIRDAMERLREYEETPLPPEERARKELMDLRQRFQTWSRQQHGSLDGCLHSIAVESDLPDGVTLPMVAEAALRELAELRANLDVAADRDRAISERVRRLPEKWREDLMSMSSPMCADELEQALEGKP